MSQKPINLLSAYLLLLSCILSSGCSHKASRDEIALSLWTAASHARSDGDHFLAEGKINDAIKEYQKACQLDPSSGQNHYKLAKAYERSGKLDPAIAEYREVIKIHYPNPNVAEYGRYHFWLAQALNKKGSREEARTEYSIAYKIASQDKTHSRKLLGIAQQAKAFASE